MPKDEWGKYGKNWKYYKPKVGGHKTIKQEAPIKDYRYTKFKVYKDTDQWKTLVRLVHNRDMHMCQYCGNDKQLTVKHLTFDRYGREELDDLKTICYDCVYGFKRDSNYHPKSYLDKELNNIIQKDKT